MRILAIVSASIIASVILGFVALILLIDNIMEGMCADQVEWVTPSPDRLLEAKVVVYDCGATTREAIHVVVAPESDGSWVAQAESILVIETSLRPQPTWIDNNHLEVAVPADSRVFRQENAWRGVSLTYTRRP